MSKDSRATILSIGNELMLGLILDTNANWLCQELAGRGITVVSMSTVGDDTIRIAKAISDAVEESKLVIMTGGLGPTDDDRTRAAIALAAKVELKEKPELVRQIEERFRQIGRPMSKSNLVQALIPENAEGIPNSCGTAPGVKCHIGNSTIFAMPGVPKEMKEMFTRNIAPFVESKMRYGSHYMRMLHLFGTGESLVGEALGELMREGANPEIGTAVREGVITVRLVAKADSKEEAIALSDRTETEIRNRLGEHIFAEDGESFGDIIVRLLKEKSKTLSLAESCTGGMVADMIVSTPGSSAVLLESCVTYSNKSKINRLEIDPKLIEKYGAVSREAVVAMARGSRNTSGSDYALAITGIAGPDGGSPDKPVGTVWIALASESGVCYTCRKFATGRSGNRLRAAHTALDMLRRSITRKAFPWEVECEPG